MLEMHKILVFKIAIYKIDKKVTIPVTYYFSKSVICNRN